MINFPSKNKSDSENSTGLLFMRAYNKWHSEIKRKLKILKITHPQFVVLTSTGYLMQTQSEVTQIMVSKISGVDVMTVSQIFGTLEKNGYVQRTEHSKDTRAKSIILTEKGLKKMEQALPVVEKVDIDFFRSLKEDEKTFIEYLQKLNAYGFSQE